MSEFQFLKPNKNEVKYLFIERNVHKHLAFKKTNKLKHYFKICMYNKILINLHMNDHQLGTFVSNLWYQMFDNFFEKWKNNEPKKTPKFSEFLGFKITNIYFKRNNNN